MKLSKETLDILKNFSEINQSIMLEEGNTIRTMSPAKSIVAVMEIGEEIPSTAGIYELTTFINVVSSLFNDPEIDFEEHNFRIHDGKNEQIYPYVDPSMITTPKKKTVDFPKPDVVTSITKEDLVRVMNGGKINSLPDIAFEGNGETLYLKAFDAEGSNKNSFSAEIGETQDEFRAVISTANLKLIPQAYEVEISKKGISKFTGENGIIYYIAVNSKYSDMGN